MLQNIPVETVQSQAQKIAKIIGENPDEIALFLIHKEYGVDNIDFSGGVRATPDDGTVPINPQAS